MKYLAYLFLCLPFLVNAQTTYTPQGLGTLPSNYLVNCIYPLNDNEVWALASEASGAGTIKLCKTTDGGNTWNVKEIDGTVTGLAIDLFVQNSSIAYVNLEDANGDNQLYKSIDGGNTWYRSNAYSGTLIYMYDNTEGAMIGVQSGSYSTDSFHTAQTVLWSDAGGPPKVIGQRLLSGPNAKCNTDSGVFFIYPKGYVVRTQDKGRHWKGFLVNLDNSVSTCSIAASGNEILALQWPVGSIPKGMSRSFDGGHTWENISSSIPSSLNSPKVLTNVPQQKGHFILTGLSELFHSTDSGKTWTDLTLPSAASLNSSSVFIMSSTNIGWLGMGTSGSNDPIIYKCQFNFSGSASTKSTPIPINNIRVFPNPAKKQNSISALVNGKTAYQVVNTNGRALTNGIINEVENQINISNLAQGVYYLKLQTNQRNQIIRFVID